MAQRAGSFEPKETNQSDQKNDEQTAEDVAKRSIAKPNEDSNKEEPKKAGLFTNLTSGENGKGFSLFNNANLDVKPTQNLFGGTSTSNLFGSSSAFGSANTGLFANNNASSLFNNSAAPQTGLFSVQFNQPPKNESDDEGEEGGDEPQQASDDEKKEIVMKYDYKKETEQILKFGLIKFRQNSNDVLDKGNIALEKVVDSDNNIVIYRNHIHQIKYQGLVLKGVTKVGNLNNKKENLVLKLYRIGTEDQQQKEEKEQKKSKIDTIKLMFEKSEDAEAFRKKIEELTQEKKQDS